MLQWNDLHPYNAVHVTRVPAALDLERLRRVVDQTLEGYGLTGLSVDRQSGTFQYRGGPARCELQGVDGGGDAAAALAAEVERQINTRFASDAPFTPFRGFALDAGDGFHFGLAYFHAVAGAESVVQLLQALVGRYLGQPGGGLVPPVDLEPTRTQCPLGLHPGLLLRRLVGMPSQIRALRSSCRPSYRDERDLRNGFVRFSFGPGHFASLKEAAKGWGVTLNDLFLALLLAALSPLAGARARAPRRRRLALGCVVNTRKDLEREDRRSFGLFLGSFVVTHEVPEGVGLRELARDIRVQTLRIKDARLYLGSPLELAVARCALRLCSDRSRRTFYPKHYPLWGGVTNVNLDALGDPSGGRLLDYFRAVSTGPATPLVLSVTTVGAGVNVGLSYRTTVFSAADVAGLQARLLDAVGHLQDAA